MSKSRGCPFHSSWCIGFESKLRKQSTSALALATVSWTHDMFHGPRIAWTSQYQRGYFHATDKDRSQLSQNTSLAW